MIFHKTSLAGAWLIELDPVRDERGFFARTFCVQEYDAHGLETRFVQHSVSHSAKKGTLRGMHFQRDPHAEVKVVSCRKGGIWDVIIDLRPTSPSYCRWEGFELTVDNHLQLYIPKGFAHGAQSLCDDIEVSYLISTAYVPGASAGVRYDDPAFNIDWPLSPTSMSVKDQTWPDFRSVTP